MRQPPVRLTSILLIGASALLFSRCGGGGAPAPTPTPALSPTPTPTPTPAESRGDCVSPPSGLVAWWPADENAVDLVGQRNGSLVGASTFAAGMVEESFRFPNTGKAAPDYVGTDWISIPDDGAWDLGSRSFTIEMWVRIDGAYSQRPHQQPLIGHTEGPGQTNKWILWLENGNLTFHVNSPEAAGFNPLTGAWSQTPGEWHHVAVTREASSWRLFVDGRESAVGTNAQAIPEVNAELTIGRAEATWLEGLVDEVAIYDRALSVEEITAIFSAGGDGKCRLQ